MKDIEIKGFWTKLMAASKSINKIPENYMTLAVNSRIYDGWIWARRWKKLLCEVLTWTQNKGGFILKDNLYQICDWKIFLVNKISWNREEKVNLWYDVFCDLLVYSNDFAIIVAKWQKMKVFDWNNLIEPTTVPSWDTWDILEYCNWYTFYAIKNTMYISRPIKPEEPHRAYDFTSSWSQTVTYETEITGLKGTMNGIYIFTKDKVEFIWWNNLQNISWSPTFISSPLGSGWEPINNQSIVASGDKIFYVTKNLTLNTINFVSGIENASLWELSLKPIISIKEYLQTLDYNQERAFWFFNQNDKTVQFHLKTKNFWYNNNCLVYDITNDTFSVDIGKYYNYVVKDWYKYFWFSDVNCSIFEDDVGNSDSWVTIPFKIVTQNLRFGSILQKRFGWFFIAWVIWRSTELEIFVRVDGNLVFQDKIRGEDTFISWFWETWWDDIWRKPIWWDFELKSLMFPFDKLADEGRIFVDGTRIQIEITSSSVFSDFLIDVLWVRLEWHSNMDIKNKF